MAKALVIKSSVFSGQGESSKLVDHAIATLKQEIPGIEIIERDLGSNPVDHLSGATTAAFFAENPAELSEDQQAALALSNTLIDELKSVDYLVLGVPMYNFGIPSTLKAWIDYVARAGVTFRYTENGPEGLVTNVKKTIITAARGGMYKGTPKDTQTGYLKDVLSFLGINNVEFAYAEALNMGEKESAVKQAQQDIDAIVEAI
ncbi:FMN-dependent NADH-azoreductase [Litoribrevibacter euphylliae]|uniref:FMN dependent NADH:quinone oxidoreductase n=1 Tax=Litoribrevibacter euphylliae TaxID=1834034 RepID=A0ABV7HE28_9GAMM